jgi:hypothetical protein
MTDYVAAQSQEANSITAGDQYAPRISPLAGGGWVVAWVTAVAGGNEVHAQVFNAAGAKSGSEITVFSALYDPPGTTFAIGDVAGLGDGSFVVTAGTRWLESPPQGAPYHLAVFGQHVSASGQLLNGPVPIESHVQQNDEIYGGAVVPLPSGGWASVLTQATTVPPFFGASDSLRIYDAAGNPVATAQLMGNDVPILSRFPNGNILNANSSWSAGPSSIAWQVLSPSGQSLGSAHTGSQGGTVQQFHAASAVLASGIGVVVYSETTLPLDGASQSSWYVMFVSDQGQSLGEARPLDFHGGSSVRITATADGGFVATWMESSGSGTARLMAEHFDAGANPAGHVQVLDPEMPAAAWAPYGYVPYEIVATADGGFEVVTSQSHAGTGADIELTKFVVSNSGGGGYIDANGGITPVPDGNFTIVGSAGLDQISLAGAHTQYSVAQGTVAGPQGTDTLSGIERVRFGDGYAIALDVDGDAGQAYRLYKAAFDRAPDLPGLGFQMNDLDMGYPLVHVAQNFIDSPEFQAKYGPGLTNEQFITLLYENVLGREPEAAGLQYHLNEFAQGDTRANMLTHFSESPENKAIVLGQIEDGMLYIPYA